MKHSAVIFDLDGVLIHTDECHYLAWKQIADKIGLPFDRTINEQLRGVSRMASLEIILNGASWKFSDAEKEDLADEKNAIYRRYLSAMTPRDVPAETLETLAALKKMGVKVAIGSASKNATYILDHVGLMNGFDAIIDGNDITRTKPDPEVFLKAAQRLGLDPSAYIVVEDAIAGIDAANAGGFDSAGIGYAAPYKMCKYSLDILTDLLKYV